MRRALASARFDSNDTRHPQTYDEGSEQGAGRFDGVLWGARSALISVS
jgi:hypothetical protein